MPWVQFLEERTVKDQYANTPRETRFLKGQVVELSEMSAQRWLRRKACRLVDPPTSVPPQGAGVSLAHAPPPTLAEERDKTTSDVLIEEEKSDKKRGKK